MPGAGTIVGPVGVSCTRVRAAATCAPPLPHPSYPHLVCLPPVFFICFTIFLFLGVSGLLEPRQGVQHAGCAGRGPVCSLAGHSVCGLRCLGMCAAPWVCWEWEQIQKPAHSTPPPTPTPQHPPPASGAADSGLGCGALLRAPRVVPELEVPAHVASWERSHPGMVADCNAATTTDLHESDKALLDPTSNVCARPHMGRGGVCSASNGGLRFPSLSGTPSARCA